MLEKLRAWASALKRDALVLWLAARDPRTPWQAKLLAGIVAAYLLSPIDLIPDFIPVLGYLDDLLIAPAGVWLALRMIPEPLVAELRAVAQAMVGRPRSRAAAAGVVAVWFLALGLTALFVWRALGQDV
jgi:uncharacterized membrane protein YkvA (DUF1232 family)